MWTADELAAVRLRRAFGHTLVELMISIVVITIGAVIVSAAMGTATNTERYLDTVRRVTERGQRALHEISAIVEASRKILQDDPVGRSYLTALDLSRAPLARRARLPFIDTGSPLGPDEPDGPRTGNIILLVREADPLPCVADPGKGTIVSVDTYRIVCIYPHESGRYVVPGTEPAKDLVYWWSRSYASHQQLKDIPVDKDRRAVVRDLVKRHGVQLAWNIEEPAFSGFHWLDPSGVIDAAPLASVKIEEDVNLTDLSRLGYANTQLARTSVESRVRNAVLTDLSGVDPWVPDGFEVQLAGTGALKQTWLHLVLEAPSPGTRATVVEKFTLIVAARSF